MFKWRERGRERENVKLCKFEFKWNGTTIIIFEFLGMKHGALIYTIKKYQIDAVINAYYLFNPYGNQAYNTTDDNPRVVTTTLTWQQV